jgi:hypothetical protein
MRHHLRLVVLALALAVFCAGDLAAQRRGTSGGGSDTRGTPSGGSGRATGGGSRGGSGGGTTARPSSGGSRGGTAARPSEGRTADDATAPPSEGKIAGVRRTARGTPRDRVVIIDRGVYLGGCWDCSYWGWYHGRWGWYHGGWWYPARDPYDRREREDDEAAGGGQGYLDYPYAGGSRSGTTFVEERTLRRSSYGALSAQYFNDYGSTTVAGRFALEAAFRTLRVEAEYARYAEPLATRTDRMSSFRIGVGLQPRLGNSGYVVAGIAARSVALDGGEDAGGLEGQLGLQLLPVRPVGLNVTGRMAAMRWEGASDYFTLREMNSTASLFVGRVEIQGGWHWLKLGSAPAFGGPVIGTRLWF